MTVKQSLAPATLKNNNDLHKTISNENKPTKMYVCLLKDDSLQSCYEVVMLNTITLAPSHLDRSWQNTQQQNCWHDSPTSTWCSVDPYSCSADQQVLCCYSFIIPIRVNAYPSKADMFLSIFSFCASSLDLHWKTYPLKHKFLWNIISSFLFFWPMLWATAVIALYYHPCHLYSS